MKEYMEYNTWCCAASVAHLVEGNLRCLASEVNRHLKGLVVSLAYGTFQKYYGRPDLVIWWAGKQLKLSGLKAFSSLPTFHLFQKSEPSRKYIAEESHKLTLCLPIELYPILAVKPLENIADAEQVTARDNVMAKL